VKFTQYFQTMHARPDRDGIRLEWIQRVMDKPSKEVIQEDGRIRRWAAIAEADGRFLRVILLPDGETVHNAFFDRRFSDED
jgi:pyrroloquinoline quinone (PQQ) biosynthesis protein C